jgi:catechol 2,3-dioxygenase-like lactoylglutathione lyase family enzyme
MTMPAIETLVETALYGQDLVSMEAFYRDVLQLSVMGREEGRHVFFRAGPGSMLLIFNPVTTLRGDILPAHGATGSGHVALGIRADTLAEWRQWLAGRGVAIEKEVNWPRGSTSLYFRDPAGNLVELLTPGLWGLPEGW